MVLYVYLLQNYDFYTLHFGFDFPAKKSAACDITGTSKIVLITGIWRPTVKTIGRKFPNKFKNPKLSKHIPINPHRNITKTIPRAKHMVPRIRSRLAISMFLLLIVAITKIIDYIVLPCE